MHLRLPGSHAPHPHRLPALLQAALLVLTLFAAPEVHRHTCTGVCALGLRPGTEAEGGARPGEGAAAGNHACCHGGGGALPGAAEASPGGRAHAGGTRGHSSGGCTCLDDCCTLYAHGTTPDVVTDTGPAAVLVTAPPAAAPSWLPRVPHARLLPYPTGPPVAA